MSVTNIRVHQAPASVGTRLGKLTHESGYPTAETTQKLFDERSGFYPGFRF